MQTIKNKHAELIGVTKKLTGITNPLTAAATAKQALVLQLQFNELVIKELEKNAST